MAHIAIDDPADKVLLYCEKPEWEDVTPIPQYDGVNPIAPIFYTPECKRSSSVDPCRSLMEFAIFADKDATDYFRAIVRTDEVSERVLQLTEDIIRMNPAHYSAW